MVDRQAEAQRRQDQSGGDERTYCAYKLNLDTRMLQPLAIFGADGDCALDALAIQI